MTRRRVLPDTRHVLVVDASDPVELVRLDVYPDGGISRLRVWGEIEPEAYRRLLEAFTDR